MGSLGTYRFKWPHAAEEVIVTGTFDNWAKSIKLDKKNWVHEKTVEIPHTKDEILYKFVVNGQWRTDPSHAIKRDHEGNENNVLDPEDILPAAAGGMITTVAPGATTAALAGAQPLTNATKDMPGAFPSTPMESGPVPTLQDRTVGVNPLPATAGAGNPISLQPGEKVPDPSTFTSNTIANTVTTDKASYERGAGGVTRSSPDKVDDSAAHFGRPAAGGTIIPESSLPMGNSGQKDVTDPTISSAGPGSTTAALAGQQPVQPRGEPQVISKDADANKGQGIAGYAAAGVGAAGVAVAGAAVAANKLVKDKTGKDPVSSLPQSAQDAIHQNADSSNLPEKVGAERDTATTVPSEVKDSLKEAGQAPEAASNATAVQEKSTVEKELLSKVPETNAQGAPAPTQSATTAANAPTTTSSTGAPQLGDPVAGGLAPINLNDKAAPTAVAGGLAPTTLNYKPDATGSAPTTLDYKAAPTAVAGGLAPTTLSDKPQGSTGAASTAAPTAVAGGLAPTTLSDKPQGSTGAASTAVPTAVAGGLAPTTLSDKPQVTTGVASSATPATSTPSHPSATTAAHTSNVASTPHKDSTTTPTPAVLPTHQGTPTKSSAGGSSPSTPTSKTNKRRSFMQKIKDKLHHKD